MSNIKSQLIRSAKSAARITVVTVISILAIGAIRFAMDWISKGHMRRNWLEGFELLAGFAAIWFVVLLLYNYVLLYLSSPAEEVLMQEPSEADPSQTPLKGFVAMEYFWLILNRTYVIFTAPEGLYGWKALGPVSNADRMYFQPFVEMLEDPTLMRDRKAIVDLSGLRGGLFIRHSEIVRVEIIDKQKWGMGGIPHSGRVRIHLTSGSSREFILLGSVYSDAISESILTGG